MKTSQDNVIFVENVALVLSNDSNSLKFPIISTKEFLDFSGDVNETVELETAESKPLDEKTRSIMELFGSWVESGDEDRQLDELYRSRLAVSTSPIE
jgi:hypothetical protein